MAQLLDDDILQRIVSGETSTKDGLAALVDRSAGRMMPSEGDLLDYKRELHLGDPLALAELARDILAFSNTHGGLLVVGVANDGTIVGHPKIDFRRMRDGVGLYSGTRVNFDCEEVSVSAGGRPYLLLAFTIHRSLGAYPNLLRKDIELRASLIRKLKYVKGSLLYREKDETKAESIYGDVEGRARELGFSGAGPRTRTSFQLQEDRPGVRLYAPINDRFFGREAELAELLSKFEDPRGRGVSIAGFGGVGKTELAIRMVSKLQHGRMFKTIYSGSAKQTLLGPGGSQQTEPVFIDLPSFLADLSGWLGLNASRNASVAEMTEACISELKKKEKVLLFVDNLETVDDRELFDFIDNKLPSNCWIIATARVHKVRNFLYPKELREMDPDDAARLLRYELKRQGQDERAATHIDDLRAKARQMFCHPLAVRWFAWAYKKDPSVWTSGIGDTDIRALESFCVAHTLGNLEAHTQKVLGAVIATSGLADATPDCVRHTSGLPESIVERSLWDLECAGLVLAGTDDEGLTTYSVAPLAEKAGAELARKNAWEADYVQNLRSFVRLHQDAPPDSPLVRDLLRLEPRQIQDYTEAEIQELELRVNRAMNQCPDRHKLKLLWLRAECQRHLDSLVTADKYYKQCAEIIIAQGPVGVSDVEKIRILIEAATVAKSVPSQTQLARAIVYLRAVEQTNVAPSRVLGMMTEIFALLHDEKSYSEYLSRVTKFRDSHFSELSNSMLQSLEDALVRAKSHLERRQPLRKY
jgi:hypothetical protein